MEQEQAKVQLSWSHEGIPQTYTLITDEVTIGRHGGCDVVLDQSSISRKHAQILMEGEQHLVKDLDSSYGTRLNGKRLTAYEAYPLEQGDKIQVGKQTIWYQQPDMNLDAAPDPNPTLEIRFSNLKLAEEIETFREKMQNQLESAIPDSERVAAVKTALNDDLNQLNAFIESKLKEYEVLQEVTQIIGRILDVRELLATSLKLVSKVLNADRGFIILYDTKHGTLQSMVPRHFDRTDSPAFDFDLTFSQSIAKTCFDNQKIVFIEDALQDERFHSSESIIASSIRSVVCIPLQQGKEVSGVIYLDNLRQPGCFYQHQTDFLQAFACQTAIALENAKLYTQAVTDDLTRLYNRQYIDERIYDEMVRARRYERECSLIILDVDFFKKVNDTYGHHAGDLVLEGLANVLRENARTTDVVSRYGGEEFLMLLPETDREGALSFAERLRSSAESMQIKSGSQTINITISCGVATYIMEYQNNLVSFVDAADKALYRAKHGGRNQVVMAE